MRRQGEVFGAAIEATEALLGATDTPGATIAVAVDGGPIASRGVGFADLARTVPMDAGATFSLYSVTKTILAVAALRLVEAGELDLDRNVAGLLPDVSLPAPITLRQLLNHTAGIRDYGAMPEYHRALRDDPGRPWSDAEFLERVLGRGLLVPPGTGWAYANVGYLLVRRIVEDFAGGGSLGRALYALAFHPLGLRRTAVAASLADTAALTPGHSAELDGELRDIHARYHPGWVSHGVVTSTAAETAGIIEALFAGRLVSRETLAAMLEGVEVGGSHPEIGMPGYGLGLMLDLDSGAGLVAGHAGGGPGYATAAFRFETPEGRTVTSVALANRDAGEVGLRIAFAVARACLVEPR